MSSNRPQRSILDLTYHRSIETAQLGSRLANLVEVAYPNGGRSTVGLGSRALTVALQECGRSQSRKKSTHRSEGPAQHVGCFRGARQRRRSSARTPRDTGGRCPQQRMFGAPAHQLCHGRRGLAEKKACCMHVLASRTRDEGGGGGGMHDKGRRVWCATKERKREVAAVFFVDSGRKELAFKTSSERPVLGSFPSPAN